MKLTAADLSNMTEDKARLILLLNNFFSSKTKTQHNKIIIEIENQLRQHAQKHNNNKQSIGAWISNFLPELISQIKVNDYLPECRETDNLILLLNLPKVDDDKSLKSLSQSIDPQLVKPLAPYKFLSLIQICTLLIELDSQKTDAYLEELKQIDNADNEISVYELAVMMLVAKSYAMKGQYIDEQIAWLDMILRAWSYLDKSFIVNIIAQWIVSLDWLRPNSLRKELLLTLYETSQEADIKNQALILFELFNLPDKTVTTGEKLSYLNKLQGMPPEYFSYKQLQSIYYFSGSIKSSIESSFKESVSDFQQSNYYIYKYWSWIKDINHFFLHQFAPDDYLDIQKRIEQKVVELINLINTQSNAYVETLQSNFAKIDELYHQVEELSLRDSLTGLYNRRFLYNNISELLLLAVRQQTPLSFVMIDIDDFKPVNDTYGHLAGDYILSEISLMLKNYFRKSDFIVRYGGEEFLIVMFNSNHIQAEQTLDNLRKTLISSVFRYQNIDLHVTVSIGIASCVIDSPYATINLEKLIAEADEALYESKTHGKNRITSRLINIIDK